MRADQQLAAAVFATALACRTAILLRRGERIRTRLAPSPHPSVRRPVTSARRSAILIVVGMMVGGLSIGGPGLVCGAIGASVLARAVRVAEASRRANRFEQELPVALEAIARVLRTGTSPLLAIDEASTSMSGPVAQDLHELVVEAGRFGLRPAALAWGRRRPQAASAARSLVVALDAGRGTADGLDAIALTLRERSAVHREVRALATQARLSASVMACTPVGFATLLCGSDPDARAFLLRSRIGWTCLALGLGMDLLGYRWMRAIARAS